MADQPLTVSSDLPSFAAVPRWLAELPEASDAAVRLFAVLTRWDGLPDGIIPALSTIATRAGWSVDKVRRTLRELRDLGAVTVEPRYEDGRQTSNRYVLRYWPGDPGTDATLPPGTDATLPPGTDATQGIPRNQGDPGTKEEHAAPAGTSLEPPTKAAEEGWETATELAEYLADAIVASGGEGTKRPRVTVKWVQTLEQLMRLDGRTPDEVRAAIDWVHRGDGHWWSDKVLSPDALRRHYEKMRRQARRGSSRASGPDLSARYAAAANELRSRR